MPGQPLPLWRHLNKLRWLCLSVVFLMLILLPMLSIYQNYVAAHAYHHLSGSEKAFFDVMQFISTPFTNDPEHDLDAIKGTTWSGQLFGLKLSDPLALASQMAAGLEIYWPFVLTALLPIAATLIGGRFFCGWICPATLIYELTSNLGLLLNKSFGALGYPLGQKRFSKKLKYMVLAAALALSTLTGTVLISGYYPPAVIGRELYFSIALSGFSSGTLFLIATILFDLLVSRRGFCRYICPGGALYALLGRFRLVRVKRLVEPCNDCGKCNAVCEFDLNPMRDDFGQECNNCTACIAVCPKNAMTMTLALTDQINQGCGHYSKHYRQEQGEKSRQHGDIAITELSADKKA
ncbi:MAG: ferredoxin-type protein NapH [Phenylobacterium sp.]|jgi:ferredoxin-type protein NapH